jgi:hypothetical protein
VTAALVPFLRTRNRSSLAHTRSAECWQQFALCRSSTACRPVSLGVRSDHADTIVPSGFHLGSPRTGRVVSALVFGGAVGGGAAKGGRDHEDGLPETAIHASYLPWLARVDALIGKPARLDLARHTSFLAAWREGLNPHEAVADAKIRSNARRSPRWRMRWKQAI